MIGIFDSGLGGLTALKELKEILPGEDLVYFGDTGRVPYGTKSRETIVRYALQDVRFLRGFSPEAILVACGTVSSGAMKELRESFDFPIIGVVEATARSAANVTKNGKIGVIGTSATIRSGSYTTQLKKINPDLEITEKACPLFVSLVESGFITDGDEVTRLTCERYLAPIREAGCDTLILGCTHYPIIAHEISKALPGVALISSGKEGALMLREILEKNELKGRGNGKINYYVSDDPEGFSQNAHIFLGDNIGGDVKVVDIEKY